VTEISTSVGRPGKDSGGDGYWRRKRRRRKRRRRKRRRRKESNQILQEKMNRDLSTVNISAF